MKLVLGPQADKQEYGDDNICQWLSLELQAVLTKIDADMDFSPGLYIERSLLERLIGIREQELRLMRGL